MLIKKLLETRRADAELTTDIRAALIESLFAPIASLVVGAVACSIIGVAVALRVGNEWLMAISIAHLRGRHVARRLRGTLPEIQEQRASRRHQAVGARLRNRRLGVLGPARPAVLDDDHADDGRVAADGRHHHVDRLCRGHFGPQRRAAVHRRRPVDFLHAADGVALLLYPDWVHKALGFVVAAVHLRHDGHHAQHPRHHHPGADHDAQGSGAGGPLPGAGEPLRHRAQQHVARPVHARSAGPPAGLERAVPRTAASAEGAGARRHADLATRPPQHPRRQSPRQERQTGHQRTGARAARGQVRPVSYLARRRPHHRRVAPDDGRRRLGRHPGGRDRAQARAGAHHASRQIRRTHRPCQPRRNSASASTPCWRPCTSGRTPSPSI